MHRMRFPARDWRFTRKRIFASLAPKGIVLAGLAAGSLVTLGGCSAMKVKMGWRVDLTQVPIASLEASLPKGPERRKGWPWRIRRNWDTQRKQRARWPKWPGRIARHGWTRWTNYGDLRFFGSALSLCLASIKSERTRTSLQRSACTNTVVRNTQS